MEKLQLLIKSLQLQIKIIQIQIQILLLKKKKILYIIIHHTATSRDYTTFEAINNGHQRRWSGQSLSQLGFYCGYQYLITGDGKIHQARLDTESGWHTSGHNQNTIGIVFTGNFMIETMSNAQISSLKELLAEKLKQYSLDKSQIKLHRDFTSTLCPGENLADWIDNYKNS